MTNIKIHEASPSSNELRNGNSQINTFRKIDLKLRRANIPKNN